MGKHFDYPKEGLYEAPWQKKLVFLALILVILSLAGCIALSLIELLTFRPEKGAKPLRKVTGEAPPPPKPSIHPLSLLPDQISDFLLNARHSVPGYESYMAEAIYQPEKEELSRITPMNTYVKVTYFERAWDAEKAVKDNLIERYPEEHKVIDLHGQKALSGFEQGKKSFFIGWAVGNYLIEIDTSYTAGVPGTKNKSLQETGTRAAFEVQKVSAKALGKK